MRFEETIGISHLLKVTEHEMRQRLDKALSSFRLTYPQYSALSTLEHQPGISNAELARAGCVTAQTMNRIILNLEEMGLVKRTSDPGHGLKQILKLSAKGEALVCKAHLAVDAVEREMIAGQNLKTLQKHLNACLENLRRG
jgi:DNA-binding MarR family transcriptional regulator